MPFIDIDGDPFHVRIDGPDDAPALLLSNSLSSDMTMWEDQIPAWSRHARIVRYDQRGHGRSVVSPGPCTMDRLGRDALGVLNALDIARADLVGLSLGGMVGQWLATHAPGRLGRVVLANTAAHMGPPSLWNDRIALARAGGMEATVEPTVTRWFPADFHARRPDVIERMRAMIRRTPLEGYVASCLAIRDMDQRETIRRIAAPVLVVIGARDPATTPAAGEEIRAAIAGAEAVHLDAGHISNVERPDAFAAAVSAFLTQGRASAH